MSWPASRALVLVALVQGGVAACAPNPRAPQPRDAGVPSRDAGAVVDSKVATDSIASAPTSAPAAPVTAWALGYRVDAAAAEAGGAVRVFVRWPDIPAARRASPGEDGCGAPRRASAEVDELWGVAEVAVALELDHGKALLDAPPARLEATPCALAPRLAVAMPGQELVLGAAAPASVHVRVERRAWKSLGTPGTGLGATEVALPWLGHAVSVRAPTAETWLITPVGGAHPEPALVLWPPHPYYAVTDGDGLAVLRAVPAGEHVVHAYLPARGGARAHAFTGKVKVEPGGTAELVLGP